MEELLVSALYGLVEGITEWLPISSTGHMLLLRQLVPLHTSEDFWNMFLVVIQLGAILAVCTLFFKELNPFARSKNAGEKKQTWQLWAKIVLACLPAAIIGIPLDDWMEAHLGGPQVIAIALIVYGIIFIVIETVRLYRAQKRAQDSSAYREAGASRGQHFASTTPDVQQANLATLANDDARIQNIDEIDIKTALGIGCFQVLSMVPGTSRSGSTIIGGLLLGCSRAVAAEFTFYLAVPVMFGASALRLVKFFLKGNVFSTSETMIVLVGCIVAYAVSLAVIKFLMSYVRRHNFTPFGVYRIVLGVIVLLFFMA